MESKTYVFDGGGQGANGMSWLAPLLQQKGIDPNLLLTMNGNGGFGGNSGAWFLWIIVILALFRNGFWGNNNGSNGNGLDTANLASLINGDNGRELIMQAINGKGNAINTLATNLNCSVGQLQSAINSVNTQLCNIASQMGMSTQQVINSIQNGNNALAQQLASCCCEQRLSICQQTNTLQNTMNGGFQMLRDSNAANTNAILSKLDAAEMRAMQDKLDAERAKSSALASQLSQEHQTAQIVANQQASLAPILQNFALLNEKVNKIECALPPTVAVPYPQLQAYNPELARSVFLGTYGADLFSLLRARATGASDTTPTTPTTATT